MIERKILVLIIHRILEASCVEDLVSFKGRVIHAVILCGATDPVEIIQIHLMAFLLYIPNRDAHFGHSIAMLLRVLVLLTKVLHNNLHVGVVCLEHSHEASVGDRKVASQLGVIFFSPPNSRR